MVIDYEELDKIADTLDLLNEGLVSPQIEQSLELVEDEESMEEINVSPDSWEDMF